MSLEAPKTKSVVALAEALKVDDKKVLLVYPNRTSTCSCRAATFLCEARVGSERLHLT